MQAIQINTNKKQLDIDYIFNFLHIANWCKGIPFETVKRSIKNSLCFGIYIKDRQIGFGRVITDYATFANIVDIIVDEKYRGNGIGKLIMQTILKHPDLQGLRRITLASSKQDFYKKVGFKQLEKPEKFMEIFDACVYEST